MSSFSPTGSDSDGGGSGSGRSWYMYKPWSRKQKPPGASESLQIQKMDPFVDLQVGKTLWEGVPKNMRTELWLSILARNGRGPALGSLYMKLQKAVRTLPPTCQRGRNLACQGGGADLACNTPLQKVPQDVHDTICKDVSRSFPAHEFFREEKNQEALYRLLRAYAAYDQDIGYCQGMNFVAALLLLYLTPREQDAFACMVVLMQERGLRGHYTHDMRMLQVRLWQMGQLMSPRLREHLEANGVLTALYASAWFLTIFASEFPMAFVGRLLDVLLSATDDSVLMKVALRIVSELEEDLLKLSDMEALLTLIKTGPPLWSSEKLRIVLDDALSTCWDGDEQATYSEQKQAETVKEAVERTDKLRGINEASQPEAGFCSEEQKELPPHAVTSSTEEAGTLQRGSIPRLVPPPTTPPTTPQRDLLDDDGPNTVPTLSCVWSMLGELHCGASSMGMYGLDGCLRQLDEEPPLRPSATASSPEGPLSPQRPSGSAPPPLSPSPTATKLRMREAMATPLADFLQLPQLDRKQSASAPAIALDSQVSFGSFQGGSSPSSAGSPGLRVVQRTLDTMDSFGSFRAAGSGQYSDAGNIVSRFAESGDSEGGLDDCLTVQKSSRAPEGGHWPERTEPSAAGTTQAVDKLTAFAQEQLMELDLSASPVSSGRLTRLQSTPTAVRPL